VLARPVFVLLLGSGSFAESSNFQLRFVAWNVPLDTFEARNTY
jgi:hypothetical protein